MFGTMVHDVLEHGPAKMMDTLQGYADKYNDLFVEEQEYYGDIINDVHDIMTEYFKWYEDDNIEDAKLIEATLMVPVGQGVVFKCRLDRVVKIKKRWYLVEHKTFKRLPDENHRWRDIQTAIYMKALENYGEPVNGILWDYIGSKSPTIPQILKDGSVSSRKIVTLPTTLRRFAKNMKVKIPGTLLDGALESCERYFHRFKYPSNPRVNKIVLEDFLATVDSIKMLAPSSRVMHSGKHCDYCSYEPLCRARLGGLDEEDIIKAKYQERRERPDKAIEGDDAED